jgi:hypothetical protein
LGFDLSSMGARVLTDIICGLLIFEFSFSPLFLKEIHRPQNFSKEKTKNQLDCGLNLTSKEAKLLFAYPLLQISTMFDGYYNNIRIWY